MWNKGVPCHYTLGIPNNNLTRDHEYWVYLNKILHVIDFKATYINFTTYDMSYNLMSQLLSTWQIYIYIYIYIIGIILNYWY